MFDFFTNHAAAERWVLLKSRTSRKIATMNQLILIFLLMIQWSSGSAATWVLPESGNLVGKLEYVSPEFGETLAEIGIRYGIGYQEMVRANPGVDRQGPLRPKTRLLIPSQYILPKGPHHGIVINLAEYRLYYFPKDENVVMTYPVGIGRKGWETPTGQTSVVAKQVDPVWRPTERVRKKGEADGIPVPGLFPAGKDNPLGKHVLRLGWPTYLIHGASQANGVGMRISAGCLRMIPDDIEHLYSMVEVGTPVRVVNEPLKVTQLNGQRLIEVHPLLDQTTYDLNLLLQKSPHQTFQQAMIQQALKDASGIPVRLPATRR